MTQDDSGADNDSIDRHRSFVLCTQSLGQERLCVPRTHFHHEHHQVDLQALRLGPNNLFDATATDSRLFESRPDFTPYKYVFADLRVFKPEETFDPTDPKFERRRKSGPAIKLDDPDFLKSMRAK